MMTTTTTMAIMVTTKMMTILTLIIRLTMVALGNAIVTTLVSQNAVARSWARSAAAPCQKKAHGANRANAEPQPQNAG